MSPDRRDEESEVKSQGRLPPGQSLTQKFPVLHIGVVPPFDASTWNFRVFGDVEEEITWTWDEFSELPRRKVTYDLHCVTHWSKFDTEWEGVSVRELVDRKLIRPRPTAKFVVQHAEQGYTTNTPIETVLSDNFLLATHYDGAPLPPDHGYPLRGLVGQIPDQDCFGQIVPYLWKGAKWIRGLEFSANDQPGFWERNGYHNEADAWKEQRTTGRG